MIFNLNIFIWIATINLITTGHNIRHQPTPTRITTIIITKMIITTTITTTRTTTIIKNNDNNNNNNNKFIIDAGCRYY